jgi:hypothetical protein
MKTPLLIALLASVCTLSAQTLTLKWKTDALLPVPESVLHDSKNNLLYVSCIDGKSGEKDGKGAIAKVSLDGEILATEWVNGLDAPKGMGIVDGSLYVADLTQVVVIDIAGGKVVQRIVLDGAVFLNDITVDQKGRVFVSDSETGKIFVIENKKGSLYFESKQLERVNGLLALSKGLYIVDFATGINYKLGADKKINTFGKTGQGADGIVPIGKNQYLVSSWHGEVYHVNATGESRKLLDTREEKLNAADIEYDPRTRTLFVPTFLANSVMAYTYSE